MYNALHPEGGIAIIVEALSRKKITLNMLAWKSKELPSQILEFEEQKLETARSLEDNDEMIKWCATQWKEILVLEAEA